MYQSNTKISKTDFKILKGKDLDNWLEENYLTWSLEHKRIQNLVSRYDSGLSDPIKEYCGYGAQNINALLRAKKKLTDSQELLYTGLIYSILSSPVIKERIVVYRWVPRFVVKEMLCDYRKGIYSYDYGFLSTSFSPDVYEKCEAIGSDYVLMRLFVEKGNYAVYVPYIAGRQEQEMLFLPGCEFRYLGKQKAIDDFRNTQYKDFIYDFYINSDSKIRYIQ